MYTHNNVIGLLTRIAQSHEQLKSFGFGEYTDMSHYDLLYTADSTNLQAPTYPLLWGVIQNSQLNNIDATLGTELQKTYTLVVCDIIDTDESNKDEVLSDCEQICLDIIGILQSSEYNPYFFVNRVATLTPFIGLQENDDSAIGWTFNITFRMPYNNRCFIPSAIPNPLPIS